MTKSQACVLAGLDQAWAEFDARFDQIKLILTDGPRTPKDAAILHDGLLLIAAEVFFRRSMRHTEAAKVDE